MANAKCEQLAQARVTGQCEHLVSLGMTSNYIKRAEADGASGPKHGNTLQTAHIAPQLAAQSSTANSGMAAVRLSIRSSTPP